MIVDDEPLEREVLLDVLSKSSIEFYRCLEAENGSEALEHLHHEWIDIVVMDLKMPVMNGIHAASLIKDQFPQVKIIILTAYNDFDYALKTIKIGVEDFLLKPVSPEEFLASLQKAIKTMDVSSLNEHKEENSNETILSVTRFIQHHLQDKLTLKQLAERVYFHPQYLSRLFKQETGRTITEYITLKRIEKSKELLVNSKTSITDISQQCGFTDINYFSRVFSKMEGVPPKKYRDYQEDLRKEKLNQPYFNKMI
ncbi:response regulator [Fictibacillus sp. WQ 8-8]|uniref:response regulator transcription factor n=1 Tax=Fictibacillus sp. WQ 8-8 TaxID=2938788 RepID=UPI00210993EE|nr:response regulator [Fictibacillus sp. WQ 8-8]MCQ6265901.1 response regulator [Fictibacillus sp. WQ 8-8]